MVSLILRNKLSLVGYLETTIFLLPLPVAPWQATQPASVLSYRVLPRATLGVKSLKWRTVPLEPDELVLAELELEELDEVLPDELEELELEELELDVLPEEVLELPLELELLAFGSSIQAVNKHAKVTVPTAGSSFSDKTRFAAKNLARARAVKLFIRPSTRNDDD